jgi:hypothetical protein
MAKIINEMPDDEIDVTMEGEELEVDLEVKRNPENLLQMLSVLFPRKLNKKSCLK